ncbi:OPT oligopeptide transporter protein [Geosmithia morbida]|uniref:OPT oligopeptide transporter protein n=1 Tax=Geosmithia morbida TaxID=1094350 RepID=A0A9P4YQH8_9HYPO|nr:OPT oligopeptide transporter protein [Geosmithia morbida]KAF4120900.1 OPT oligopeptide transporter protein [Geosmithia morbida]
MDYEEKSARGGSGAPASVDADKGVLTSEKPGLYAEATESGSIDQQIEDELKVTEDDLLEAKEAASAMTFEEVTSLLTTVRTIHEKDPNFPHSVLIRIDEFLDNPEIARNPEQHSTLIYEMKLQAALITNNSPYAEVRAVVDNHDDPSTPCSTVRAWTIGILFSGILAFVNQLFSIRQPPINIDSNVAQLLAFPLGKAWEKFMPQWEFTLFGKKHNLNPGRFNKKEHMLIAIMATTSKSLPYTQYVIWTQVLPFQFNQQYARSFGYQILVALSTNFIGYGLAGLTRRFIVYPAYCVWPASLVTIALNSALHNEENSPVLGPFKKIFHISRYRFFLVAFAAMFVYFWFPNYIFSALTYFSWMTWIAPDNLNLNVLTGFQNGLGMFNPWPTFDWNVLLFDLTDPLMIPWFSTLNKAIGMWLFGFVIMGLYYTNTWNTAYLPINSNRVYDHFGQSYNVSQAINEKGLFDKTKYSAYSAPYMSAGNTVVYGTFFAIYMATVVYVALFHRYEVVSGFKNMWSVLRRRSKRDDPNKGEYMDIHSRLMRAYPEVSEIWYMAVLITAAALGFAGIGAWPTYTTLAVVPYGVLLAFIFVIPIGIVKAMTGIEVTTNVFAEFIGGLIVEGNALAMNYFKSFGYVTCAHAIQFSNDLKIAHYLKINPWFTFICQLVATFISTFVSVGVLAFQIGIDDVCTTEASMRFTCPGQTTFFTASVLWGTIGPKKIFGHNGQYAPLLIGFGIGLVVPIIFYLIIKWKPRNRYIRQFHPVAIFYGGINWAPYNFSYVWPAVPISWLSWIFIRGRYLSFWSKYNFVLSASFSAAIAIAGIIMLFSVQWVDADINWWGNTVISKGCEGDACTLKVLGEGERFYPWWDSSKAIAP